MQQKEKFPVLLFSVYAIYYAGQAVQSAYQSLFLTQSGFSPSQIGIITSATTVFLLIMQTCFGSVSDRAQVKNRVICFLYAGSFLTALLLFFSPASFFPVLVILAMFSGFFLTLIPLTDDFSTALVSRNRQYDYGAVRMGGTIGYALMMLVSGYLLNDNYRLIFLIIAISLLIGFFFFLALPPVAGNGAKEKRAKSSLKTILDNKVFLTLIVFSLLLSVGETLYNSYYPIYYLTIGGNSRLIGIMQFVSAISEVPCLFLIGRVIRRFGTGKTLGICAVLACLRWLLLYITTNPITSIFVGLLHGFTFSCSNYCMVNYISKRMEGSARASSQVFKTTVSMIFSRAIFGCIGGILYESCGPRSLLLLSAVIVGAAAIFMLIWSKNKEEALRI